MKRTLFPMLLTIVLMLVGLPFYVLAAEDEPQYTVISEIAKVYEKSSIESDLLVTVKKDYKIAAIDTTKSFIKFQFKKKNSDSIYIGYILKTETNFDVAILNEKNAPSSSSAPTTPSFTPPTKGKEQSTANSVSLNTKYTVYWGNTGDKVHISSTCRTIKNGTLSGTLEECKLAGHTEGWCGVCSKGWSDDRFLKDGNPNIK